MASCISSVMLAVLTVLSLFLIETPVAAAGDCCGPCGKIIQSVCAEAECKCTSTECTNCKVLIKPLGVELDGTRMDILFGTVMVLAVLVPIYLAVTYIGNTLKLRFTNILGGTIYNCFFLIMWAGQVILIYILYGDKDSWKEASIGNVVGVFIIFLTGLALLQVINPWSKQLWYLVRYGWSIGWWNAFWGPDCYLVYFGNKYAGRVFGLPHMRTSILMLVTETSVSVVGGSGQVPVLGRTGKVSITRYNKFGLQTYMKEASLTTKEGNLVLFLQSESRINPNRPDIVD